MLKNTAVGVLVVCAGSIVLGCGDGEQTIGATSAATGAATSTGGAKATGGSSAHTGGTTSTSGGSSNKGGSSNTGGTSTNGGSKASGGSGGIAGTSTTNIGGGTAGAAGNAGSSNGGATGTGGTSSIAGSSAKGGSSATGGATVIATSTGGTSTTGGSKGTGGSVALTCTASFVVPGSGQALSNADDLNANCQDGIQYNVVVATNAPDTTPAVLTVTNAAGTVTQQPQTTVSGATARFASVPLGSTGQVTLTASIGGTACTATENVTLSCAGIPNCSITSPTITPAHPALNGVPVAQGGDRVGTPGSPYQVAFQIATDIQDGQPVVLTVDGTVSYQATATAGKASFAGVLFSSDGSHSVVGTCTNRAGISGTTGQISYPVDTAAPALTPEKGTGTGGATISALANGDHFAMADDADTTTAGLQIEFCGLTSSMDALNVPAANPNANNFCAAIGGNTPACTAVTGTGTSGSACVNITCPGNGPFTATLTLKDAAGNPTTSTTTNLTCASTSPTVTFLDPLSDATPFSDITKRILATTNTSATRRDKNATTPGAQYDVVVCTSASPGSTAILSTGYMGQTLTQATTPVSVVAGTATQCTGSNLALFANVTLPESLTDSSFNLMTATELSATVTDLNLSTGSATADVWVDSTSPTLTLVSPTGFCGSYFNTSGTASTSASVNLTFGSSIPVVVSVQGATGTTTFTGNAGTFSQVVVSGVQLEAGSDTVSAIATKPSTNFGTFGSCAVTVGATPPPTVTWQTPLATSLLAATGNTTANAIIDNSANPGWQGTLTACTNIDMTANPSATVQFSATVGGVSTNIGTPVAINTSTQCATLADATVPEGAAVLLTATTSPIVGNPGVASITVPVSSTIPGAPTGLTAAVTDRRLTSFTPNWTAPAGSTVTGYKVRVAKTPIASQASFDAARDVPYSGSGTCPATGCTVLVNGCYIENDYYFAIAAVDYVGNQGPFLATSAATRATFVQTVLTSTNANLRFGRVIDGSGDLNGDGFADLVVTHGNGKDVYIYFGSATGLGATPFDIQGSTQYFGFSAAIIGDVNHDGRVDLAIGSPNEGSGVVYVYYGRSTWTLPIAADAIISVNSTASGDSKFNLSAFGWSISRLGDFNGDGNDDFVIGTPFYNGSAGHLAIILGMQGGIPSNLVLPDALGVNAIGIAGLAGSKLGYSTLGLGHFYGSAGPTTLVASSIGVSSNAGALQAFLGITGTPSSIDVSARNAYIAGPAGAFFGEEGLFAIGDVGPGGQLAIGVPIPRLAAPGQAQLLSGAASAGPFAQAITVTSGISGVAQDFGELVLGSGYSGRDDVGSFIGNARADLVFGSKAGGTPQIFIVDGATVAFSGSLVPQTAAQVSVNMPTPWNNFSNYSSPIADLNGDGYADLAIGQTDYSSTPTSGSVVVLY